jgi:hypothetical protein
MVMTIRPRIATLLAFRDIRTTPRRLRQWVKIPFKSGVGRSATNEKAERFPQTALREWTYAASYATSNERASELPRWLHEYRFYRDHSALQNKPPLSRIKTGVNNVLQLHDSLDFAHAKKSVKSVDIYYDKNILDF